MLRGAIRDAQLDYVMKRVFVRPQDILSGQVSGASTVLTAGLGSGTPNMVELGTSGIGALKLALTTDEIDFYWVPENLDPSQRVLIRHLWTSDYATANGTATFTTLYNNHVEGAAAVIGATALTKTHGAGTKVSATARACYWSPYGTIKGGTFGPTTLGVAIDVKCTAVTGITIASDFVYWLGMELLYTPKLMYGDGSRREARLMYAHLSNQEAGPAADV